MMVQIVQKEDPVLRKVSAEVSIDDIRKPAAQKIIKDMKTALASQKDGIAIAAPQIGQSLRIFVVSGKMLGRVAGEDDKKAESLPDLVFINPKFKKTSRKKAFLEEGCLSVRYSYGKVERSVSARVSAFDEKGRPFERGAAGLLAQVFQHEIDHLDGVLFIDKAADLKEMTKEEWDNFDRTNRPRRDRP